MIRIRIEEGITPDSNRVFHYCRDTGDKFAKGVTCLCASCAFLACLLLLAVRFHSTRSEDDLARVPGFVQSSRVMSYRVL